MISVHRMFVENGDEPTFQVGMHGQFKVCMWDSLEDALALCAAASSLHFCSVAAFSCFPTPSRE